MLGKDESKIYIKYHRENIFKYTFRVIVLIGFCILLIFNYYGFIDFLIQLIDGIKYLFTFGVVIYTLKYLMDNIFFNYCSYYNWFNWK